MTIAGLVLAGGTSRRMGEDKAFVPLAGRPLIAHVVERLAPQLTSLAINAPREEARYAGLGLPLVADDRPDTGPLGGVLAGLAWAGTLAAKPDHLVTAPVDGPFLPEDLVQRLAQRAVAADQVVIAASGDRDHPVFALWPLAIAPRLAEWREKAKSHGVRGFLAATGYCVVRWPLNDAAPDPFLNVNTREDLAIAQRWLGKHGIFKQTE